MGKKVRITKKAAIAETGVQQKLGVEFWQDKTLQELAEEQGVEPLNFEERSSNWPPDADYDEFISAIRRGRNVQ
jgi:hypothetical protein